MYYFGLCEELARAIIWRDSVASGFCSRFAEWPLVLGKHYWLPTSIVALFFYLEFLRNLFSISCLFLPNFTVTIFFYASSPGMAVQRDTYL